MYEVLVDNCPELSVTGIKTFEQVAEQVMILSTEVRQVFFVRVYKDGHLLDNFKLEKQG